MCCVAIAAEKQEIYSVDQNHLWCFDERSICVSAVELFDRFVDRSYAVGGQLLQHQRRWDGGCDCVPTRASMVNTVAVNFILRSEVQSWSVNPLGSMAPPAVKLQAIGVAAAENGPRIGSDVAVPTQCCAVCSTSVAV